MGIWNFVKDAGERIAAQARAATQLGGSSAEGAQARQAPPSKPTGGDGRDKSAGEAIADYIRAQNLAIDDLKVDFDAATSTVRVSGRAKDQATKEKVILCCGNVQGVEKVEEDISVEQPAEPAQYHTVVRGDTLSAIAKKFYGDAGKYPVIFEANKPMLKDPDKIYPGQSLRIPKLS